MHEQSYVYIPVIPHFIVRIFFSASAFHRPRGFQGFWIPYRYNVCSEEERGGVKNATKYADKQDINFEQRGGILKLCGHHIWKPLSALRSREVAEGEGD